jgi:hypothetical protein
MPMIKRFVLSVLFALAVVTTGSLLADEAPSLSLLDADSLAGWDHAPQQAQGWEIQEGQLSGTSDSTPLVSGWTFGNFNLRFHWRAVDGGAWKISLLPVPDGAPLVLTLGEGAGGCQLVRDGKPSAPPATVAASGKDHAAVVRRQGDDLVVMVDDRVLFRLDVPADLRLGLGLAVTAGKGVMSGLRVQELGSADLPTGEPLFNGRDLTGWWTPGKKEAWQAENGEIVLAGEGGNYLRTEKEYGNFTLSLEYKIRRRGNSGVGIRTARNGWPSSDGMELQIEDSRKLDASATMAIYRNVPPLRLAEETEQWNQAVIKADGAMISAWINGVLVQQVNTAEMPALKHRPPKGWIGFQDHGARTQFRNIRLIDAPGGRGLAAWYAPRTEPASRVVLDRLMNPERLTQPDGSRSQTIATQITDSGEQVLADLKGPGAIVRITRTNDAGRLAFYFDGETKPRLQCTAKQLRQALPPVCDDDNPLLTFLAFEKSLKVALREGAPGSYRIDAVTLPATMRVETFRDRDSALARGMAPALDYRHFQIRHGTYQDFEGMPRATSGNKTLPPGQRVPLVSLEGAGIIEWTRLQIDPKVLTNDDVWLEVTVDGNQDPSISTPVRMWYAGLQGGQGFHNFLVLNKGGLLNLLPMPFGKGITIAAVNRGEKPLKNVALTAAWQKADSTHQPNKTRLCAFTSDNQPGRSHAMGIAGPGRWIGYVTDGADDARISLQIDDHELPAWKEIGVEELTGIADGKEQQRCLSGRWKGLSWVYQLLAPVEFEESVKLMESEPARHAGRRLMIWYREPR